MYALLLTKVRLLLIEKLKTNKLNLNVNLNINSIPKSMLLILVHT